MIQTQGRSCRRSAAHVIQPPQTRRRRGIAHTTPALSSKYRKTPSNRFQGLDWRTITAGWTFFRSSGFPFLTVAMTMSPTPPAGNRFRRAPIPLTAMMYRFRAPELSAQFMTAPLFEVSRVTLPEFGRGFEVRRTQGDPGSS